MQAVVRSCLKQFAPELRLATGSSGQLMATHRGELLFPEVATRWSPRNLHLAIPWICYLDEQGKTIRQEPVEWTVLELPSAGAPILHSGSRINLAGRGRSQIELKGLLIPPNDQPTKLSILTLGSRQPQPGLDIFVSHEQLAAATRVQLIQSLRPSNQQKLPPRQKTPPKQLIRKVQHHRSHPGQSLSPRTCAVRCSSLLNQRGINLAYCG